MACSQGQHEFLLDIRNCFPQLARNLEWCRHWVGIPWVFLFSMISWSYLPYFFLNQQSKNIAFQKDSHTSVFTLRQDAYLWPPYCHKLEWQQLGFYCITMEGEEPSCRLCQGSRKRGEMQRPDLLGLGGWVLKRNLALWSLSPPPPSSSSSSPFSPFFSFPLLFLILLSFIPSSISKRPGYSFYAQAL